MIGKIESLTGLSQPRGIDAPALSGAAAPAANTGTDFAAVLGNVAENAVDSLKGAEALSFRAIEGKADTREVVDAVLSAQQSLQTAIALRDKVVSAYLEITKMQI